MNSSRMFRLGVEIFAVALNLALAFCFYVANSIFSYSSLVKMNLAVVSHWALVFGLLAVASVVILRRKFKDFFIRFALLVTITLFNQVCLIALLVSLLPFGGKVLPAPTVSVPANVENVSYRGELLEAMKLFSTMAGTDTC